METTSEQQGGTAGSCPDDIRQLERERARLSSIIESMADGLLLIDSNDELAYWNSRVEEFLGPGPALSIGLPASELGRRIAARTINPDVVLRNLQRAPDELHNRPAVELEIVWPQHLVLQALLFPIHGPLAQDWGYGMTLRDVTGLKEAEAIKTHLLATVSHELRTPLASIKGFATTLLRQDVEWDRQTQRVFLTIIDE